MRTIVRRLASPGIVTCMFLFSSAAAQQERAPAFAGQFYPAEKAQLEATLRSLFAGAVPSRHFSALQAIVSPHAGYGFSGGVAASAFNQIDPERDYETVFVLAPSHRVPFEGASVYTGRNYRTPLGPVPVNTALASRLQQADPVMRGPQYAHDGEHALEVQLPFLQFRMKKGYTVVPIVMGASRPEICAKVAAVLQPYFTSRNLFVISTDFSHYPSYSDAVAVDHATAQAVISKSPETLIRTLESNEGKRIPNLATSMCGESCVLTLLYLAQKSPGLSFDLLQYKNSGDAASGGKDQVVGYCAIAVSRTDEGRKSAFTLSAEEKRQLLTIARTTLQDHLSEHQTTLPLLAKLLPALKRQCGAFVTLHKHGELRGCIGHFGEDRPLYRVVQEMAIAAATEDYRFPSVTSSELSEIEIEISVLTPLRKVSSIDEIQMGRHGIYIRKGASGGTFLPQVATETGWSKEEFLGHCAQDKAGIGWDGWKDAEISVYEAIIFNEKESR
jgi:AmmeMemoRadiSam system protein B/AmmeMemoRadiSam system protein A